MLEPVSLRACQFTDDVRTLPYCREFVFTLLDLAKDQISDGESAVVYIAIVMATWALEVFGQSDCGDILGLLESPSAS